MAWLSLTLDRAAGGTFNPPNAPAWLAIGRQNQLLLPWIRAEAEKLAAYEARPRCSVAREWMRLGLKRLTELLATAEDDCPVEFRFDGSILSIHCDSGVIPMPAEGKPWEQAYSLPAAKLRRVPKRLMRDPIEVSIRDSSVTIAGWFYQGAIVLDGLAGPPPP